MCEYCKESVISSCGAEDELVHSCTQGDFDESCYSDKLDSRNSKGISRRLFLRELAIGAMAGLSFSGSLRQLALTIKHVMQLSIYTITLSR